MTAIRTLDRDEFIARASYDLDVAQERRSKVMEKPTKPSLANRVTLFNHLLAEGANPDEAAQGAGWKNLNTARACCNKGGIKLSTKASTVKVAPPRKAATINQDFEAAFSKPDKPVTVNETVIVADETPISANDPEPVQDKPLEVRTLRPYCWTSLETNLIYIDCGESIEIKPRSGDSIMLTPRLLKQFSEEINELLEIIK